MNQKIAKISLSVIVKNEANVILLMLESVYSILDYYVVVDTGSVDGTQDIVRNFFKEKGIPGEVIEHPFKNYEDARNVALFAVKDKCDYGFWIDADDKLIIDPQFDINLFKTNLFNFDGMRCKYIRGLHQNHTRISFFSTTKPWRWFGALHEVIECEEPSENTIVGYIDGLTVVQYNKGNTWTSQSLQNKYKNHVKILEEYIETADQNHRLFSRWIFYLAQSYLDVGSEHDLKKSMEYYEKRIELPDDYVEEKYISLLKISEIKLRLNYPMHEVLESYLKCIKINPNRAEHLIPIIEYYQSINNYHVAYIYSSYAMNFAGKPPINSSLFINESVYDWKIYDLHNLSCWWSGRIDEAKKVFIKLWDQVEKGLVSDDQIHRLTDNKKFNIL